MTKTTVAALILSAALFVGLSAPANAGTIIAGATFSASNQAAPPDTSDYEGIFYDGSSTFPPPSISIGAFHFTIPTGDSVTSATVSGTFGDVNIPVTGLADLFVLGGTIKVGGCDINPDSSYPPCATGTVDGSLVPWSYTFSNTDLSKLAADFSGGSIDFIAVQNSPFGAVVVGDPILDIQVASVQATPEPATIFTLAGGLVVIAAFRRRK
jgi:hypothetical protein